MKSNRNARRPVYIIGGIGRDRAGKHRWFGSAHIGGYRGWANFVQTRCLRHANAQYRRLTTHERQMDVYHMDTRRVLKAGMTK